MLKEGLDGENKRDFLISARQTISKRDRPDMSVSHKPAGSLYQEKTAFSPCFHERKNPSVKYGNL